MTAQTLSWRDAVLSGFRLVAHRPAAALSWGLTFALSGTVMAGLQVWAWRGVDAGLGLSTAAVRLSFGGLALGLLTVAVFCAAVFRATVRPDDRHAAWPRFGGDELRLLPFVLALTVASFVIAVPADMLFFQMRSEPRAYALTMDLTKRLATLLLTLLGARLALAGPMTVADRRLRLGSALGLSRGLHGRLAAIFVAALLISVAIEWAGAWGCDTLAGALGSADAPILRSSSLSAALDTAFGPASMAFRTLRSAIHALAFAVQLAPIGYVYRCLSGGPIDRAAAFD